MALLTIELRKKLAKRDGIGAGNFLFHVCELAQKEIENPFMYISKTTTLPDGTLSNKFSLKSVKRICEQLASWYLENEIKAKDLLAIYLEDCVDYFFHYLALTSIGAIPVFINGKMKCEQALAFCQSITANGILTDHIHYAQIIKNGNVNTKLGGFGLKIRDEIRVSQLNLPAWYPYKHAQDEAVMICHTSGTTGVPKPVLLEHGRYFQGILDFLNNSAEYVDYPAYYGKHRMLSLLPTAHNSGVAYFMRAALAQIDFVVLNDSTTEKLISEIKTFKPSIIVSFPCNFVELATNTISENDLRGISYWISTGDASHQVHIKKLTKLGNQYDKGVFNNGSCYIDCLGSSEMGSSLFRLAHREGLNIPLRCIGSPMSWVQAAIFDENNSEIIGPGRIGKLGVKSPSVTRGYWKNEELNSKFKNGEYFLTGDMVYKDFEGRFYQVDRISDLIKTKNGVMPSILAEEIILQKMPGIIDCTIVGLDQNQDGYQIPIVFLVTDNTKRTASNETTINKINRWLVYNGLPFIEYVQFITKNELPSGITGKVLKRKLRNEYEQKIFFQDGHE